MNFRTLSAKLLLGLIPFCVVIFAAFGQSGSMSGLTAEQREILSHMRVEAVADGQGNLVQVLRIEGLDVHVDGCLSFDCVGGRGIVEAAAPTAKPRGEIRLPGPVEVQQGVEYYTRHTLRYDRGRWTPANYALGKLAPINSRVRLESLGLDEFILLLVESGERIRVSNVAEYSGMSGKELAESLLSNEITELSASQFARQIRMGELQVGMTKREALLTRGAPPKHKTASTREDRWTYWSSRFAQEEIVFRNGVLVEGAAVR